MLALAFGTRGQITATYAALERWFWVFAWGAQGPPSCAMYNRETHTSWHALCATSIGWCLTGCSGFLESSKRAEVANYQTMVVDIYENVPTGTPLVVFRVGWNAPATPSAFVTDLQSSWNLRRVNVIRTDHFELGWTHTTSNCHHQSAPGPAHLKDAAPPPPVAPDSGTRPAVPTPAGIGRVAL